MTDFRPGLHFGLSGADYHGDTLTPEPSLSSTLARKIVNQSPLHAWTAHPRLNPDLEPKNSDAFDIGKAFHTMVLGRGAGIHVIHAEDWRSKEARAERDAARAEGRTPLLSAQADALGQMLDHAERRMRDSGVFIDKTRTEVAAFARIENVWCRALIDYAPADASKPLYDIKTCEDASPDACARSVASYGYDTQARWYLDAWKAATGEDRRFRFVFVEKSPPHEVSVIELDANAENDTDWMLDAASKCSEARRVWRECLDANQWPGYPSRVALIGAPGWYRQSWAAREIGQPVIPSKPSAAALKAARAAQAPEAAE